MQFFLGYTFRNILALAGFALPLLWSRVEAGPWIPDPGHGVSRPIVRYYYADHTFPSTSFDRTKTPSSSTDRETELKVTGEYGLSSNFALGYDLRAAKIEKTKHGVTASASGLEDQVVGLIYSLRRNQQFAHTLALNVVLPVGSTTTSPALGAGSYALEPDYQIGIVDHSIGRFISATLGLGPRVFVDTGTTQLRASLNLGAGITQKTSVFGTLFYSHTVSGNSTVVQGDYDQNEIYNILRGGLTLEYTLTKSLRLIGAYEVDIAGRDIHAGHRINAGVAWHY